MKAPITTFERIEWLAEHCPEFELKMRKKSFSLHVSMGGEKFYSEAGPLDMLPEAVNEALYSMMPYI